MNPMLFPKDCWRSKVPFDFETLKPPFFSTSYETDTYKHFSNWLPLITPDLEKRVQAEFNISKVQVAVQPGWPHRSIQYLGFEFGTWFGSYKCLATPEEYKALQLLAEECTHLYNTYSISRDYDELPDYYLLGLLRKSDEELGLYPAPAYVA